MQLSQFQKLIKLTNNKFIVQDKHNQSQYILTQQPYSQYNKRLLGLQHPNVLGVSHCWEECGTYCMLQDYTPMVDLMQVVSTHKLSEQIILTITLQIAEAMQYLDNNQLPNTVTLTNVYLDYSSQIKIDPLAVMITPNEYASPEVLRKEQDTAGIWSLGCIAYYLIKLVLPFQGESDKMLAYNILYKEPPSCDVLLYPLAHVMLKAIFTKNLKKRATLQQLIAFLIAKVAPNELLDSFKLIRNQSHHPIEKPTVEFSKRNSMCSMVMIDCKESQIDCVEQSISQPMLIMVDDPRPQVPQVITLDEFEDMSSPKRKQHIPRPQSSAFDQPQQDSQKVLFQKLSRMRPNSAVGFTAKEFIANNIKQEIQQKRLMSATTTACIQESKQSQPQLPIAKVKREVSVDLKDAHKLKNNSEFIRIYNLEMEGKTIPKANQIHMRILKPKSATVNKPCPQHIQNHLNEWRNKMTVNMK